MCAFCVLRYTLRNKDQDEVCEELVLMLTDRLHSELSGVGPEDILTQIQLDELQSALSEQVIKAQLSYLVSILSCLFCHFVLMTLHIQ